MIWILRYWKEVVAAVTVVAAVAFWYIDRTEQYKSGRADATSEISLQLAEAYSKQVELVLRQEREAAGLLAAEQVEIEKERQHAKGLINDLRAELERVQQYAAGQSSRRDMRQTPGAPATPDGEADAKGWLLFGKCTAEYAAMAEVADEQVSDLKEWQAYGRAIEAIR